MKKQEFLNKLKEEGELPINIDQNTKKSVDDVTNSINNITQSISDLKTSISEKSEESEENEEKIDQNLVNENIFRIIAESETPKISKKEVLDFLKDK
jgi:uncharacterized protein YoxC